MYLFEVTPQFKLLGWSFFPTVPFPHPFPPSRSSGWVGAISCLQTEVSSIHCLSGRGTCAGGICDKVVQKVVGYKCSILRSLSASGGLQLNLTDLPLSTSKRTKEVSKLNIIVSSCTTCPKPYERVTEIVITIPIAPTPSRLVAFCADARYNPAHTTQEGRCSIDPRCSMPAIWPFGTNTKFEERLLPSSDLRHRWCCA